MMSHVREGRLAHEKGLPRSACPYDPSDAPACSDWMAGWDGAAAESRRNGERGASFDPMDALRSAGLLRPGSGPSGR
ncbi:Rmf/CrpP family protein [Aureimonas sp. SK2]|uniref:Rmf/CrpP family protein n=1 Tax=Aureimonas sp. SK2 TaxID=3015992 RepID=UPI00387E92F5